MSESRNEKKRENSDTEIELKERENERTSHSKLGEERRQRK